MASAGPLLFIPFFCAMWFGVCFLLSRVSRWNELARDFPDRGFSGRKRWFCSAQMGQVHQKSCLILGADENGVFLSNLLPFRFGHTPLFIPWSAIKTSRRKGWIFEYVDFSLGPGAVPLTLKRGLADALMKDGGVEAP